MRSVSSHVCYQLSSSSTKWKTFVPRCCGHTKKTIKNADFPYYSPQGREGKTQSGSLWYHQRKRDSQESRCVEHISSHNF